MATKVFEVGDVLPDGFIPEGYTVTFNSNGGSNVNDLTEVTELPELPIPTKQGAIFVGWYYDETLTQQAKEGDTVTSNITLYAKWYHSVNEWKTDIANIIRKVNGTSELIKDIHFADKIFENLINIYRIKLSTLFYVHDEPFSDNQFLLAGGNLLFGVVQPITHDTFVSLKNEGFKKLFNSNLSNLTSSEIQSILYSLLTEDFEIKTFFDVIGGLPLYAFLAPPEVEPGACYCQIFIELLNDNEERKKLNVSFHNENYDNIISKIELFEEGSSYYWYYLDFNKLEKVRIDSPPENEIGNYKDFINYLLNGWTVILTLITDY